MKIVFEWSQVPPVILSIKRSLSNVHSVEVSEGKFQNFSVYLTIVKVCESISFHPNFPHLFNLSLSPKLLNLLQSGFILTPNWVCFVRLLQLPTLWNLLDLILTPSGFADKIKKPSFISVCCMVWPEMTVTAPLLRKKAVINVCKGPVCGNKTSSAGVTVYVYNISDGCILLR